MNTKKHRMHYVNLYKVSNGCSICGYNRHPAALCFDHLSPEHKSSITKNGYSQRPSAGGMFRLYSKKYPKELLINEIKKCRILCMNCHMEYTHNKISTVENTTVRMSIEELDSLIIR